MKGAHRRKSIHCLIFQKHLFIYLREKKRERERENTNEERGRERGADSHWPQNLIRGSILGLWNHDLSQRQRLAWLSHPGAPTLSGFATTTQLNNWAPISSLPWILLWSPSPCSCQIEPLIFLSFFYFQLGRSNFNWETTHVLPIPAPMVIQDPLCDACMVNEGKLRTWESRVGVSAHFGI